jgi:hypothetical protein
VGRVRVPPHIPRAKAKDAQPGRDVPRPALAPSDAVLSAAGPLTIPGPGEQYARPGGQEGKPVITGAADAVSGAPQSSSSMQLGVDSAGGYAVPKQLDSPARPKKHHRP